MTSPELDERDWISIEDPNEDRTWLFDASFLASNWTCIYGRGCPGIEDEPDPNGMRGCCSHGAHLADKADESRVVAAIQLLTKEQWQFKNLFANGSSPLFSDENGNRRTQIHEGACIFQNRPDFERGASCAFHLLADDEGRSFVDTKPEVCWQVPIRREDNVEESGHVVSSVRPWLRRDWGEGGSEFGWWCIEEEEAFVGGSQAYIGLGAEITAIAGRVVYEKLCESMRRRAGTILPHPVRRRSTT
ncbi:MAG: hypothetical protein ACC652_00455 [Acidimicrobiales bacterium]